ncbi:MAG TPA: hypothetical protein ENI45_04410, partial [Thermoplasmatales archaeon]|nr:hypothetical protein [Thermoplasmatales archaeon]
MGERYMRDFYPFRCRLYLSLVVVVLLVTTFNTQPSYASPGKPDLTVTGVDIPDEITEGETITVEATIKNIGSSSVTQAIEVALYVDSRVTPVDTYVITDGLQKDRSKLAYLSWVAEDGEHVLRVVADYHNEIVEEDEMNNDLSMIVECSPAPFDLTVTNVTLTPREIKVNSEAEVTVTVKNIGHRITKKVEVKMTVNGFTYTSYVNGDLPMNTERNISFTWKPQHFGYYHLNISVDSSDVINESNENNNFFEKPVIVVDDLPWWNGTWHYRVLVATDSAGKVSHYFNFTELLQDLNLNGVTFDNNSIRVVAYDDAGKVTGRVPHVFNESSFYSNVTNAAGVLTWDASSVFSMVYFDVKENGEKEYAEEVPLGTTESPVIYVGEPEGWSVTIVKPEKNMLYMPNATVDIIIRSRATLTNVTGKMSLNRGYNTSIVFDSSDNITWYGNHSFQKEGDWILNVTASDGAGYTYRTYSRFIIGKIDLTVVSLSVSPTKVYEKTPVEITCIVKATAAVDNVTVYAYVNNNLLANQTVSIDQTLQKVIKFSWTATEKGNATISVYVDPYNIIPEKTEENNNISRVIIIHSLPDIGVKKITFYSPVREGKPLFVYAEIENTDVSSAHSCRVALYVSQKIMWWQPSEKVYEKTVVLPPFETTDVTLTWDPAQYGVEEEKGRWIIGVEVFAVDTQQDSNFSNNRKNVLLTVTPEERNPPEISRFWCEPPKQELGYGLTVYAEVTDDTGIYNVTIVLIDPNNESRKLLMKHDKKQERWYYNFEPLSEVGIYTYYIVATDSSFLRNQRRSANSTFVGTEDYTPPELLDVWVVPGKLQLLGKEVQVATIVRDNVGVSNVNLTIIDPRGDKTESVMRQTDTDTYRFTKSCNLTGKYTFYIV